MRRERARPLFLLGKFNGAVRTKDRDVVAVAPLELAKARLVAHAQAVIERLEALK